MSHLSHKELAKWPPAKYMASNVHGHAGAGGPDLGASSSRRGVPAFAEINTLDAVRNQPASRIRAHCWVAATMA
jgi:hypothetical protein